MRAIKQILKVNNWKFYLLIKYVDDVNLICEALRKGTRYINGKLEWNEAWQTEDMIRGIS